MSSKFVIKKFSSKIVSRVTSLSECSLKCFSKVSISEWVSEWVSQWVTREPKELSGGQLKTPPKAIKWGWAHPRMKNVHSFATFFLLMASLRPLKNLPYQPQEEEEVKILGHFSRLIWSNPEKSRQGEIKEWGGEIEQGSCPIAERTARYQGDIDIKVLSRWWSRAIAKSILHWYKSDLSLKHICLQIKKSDLRNFALYL